MPAIQVDLARFAALAKNGSCDDVQSENLLLSRESTVTQYWAPFDHIAQNASLAIVGITPGRQQANNALRAFGLALRAGHSLEAALRIAKLTGSFSGPMRANIVSMLDSIGIQQVLGRVDGFDQDHPASKSDEGAIAVGGLLAA